jgi:ADP-ribose pyrophosphatase YjhB (NUDIX family)
MKVRPSIVLVQNKSVLLMKYRYGDTDVWGIPGGGIDEGETLIETLKRELKEELGLDIEVGNLIGIVETPAAGKIQHTLHCIFQGTLAAISSNKTPRVNPEHSSAITADWVTANNLQQYTLYPPG